MTHPAYDPNLDGQPWPADGAIPRPEQLIAPVCDAIRAAYRIERVGEGQDIPWTGLGTPSSVPGGLGPAEALTADNLERSADQGRDALYELVAIAMRSGMELERRASRLPTYKAGREARDGREIIAAVVEAAIDLGLDERTQAVLGPMVAHKLADQSSLEALCDRHAKRVSDSLAASAERRQREADLDPAEIARREQTADELAAEIADEIGREQP